MAVTPPAALSSQRAILIAGVGNLFFGDDGFGCDVIAAMAKRPLPAGVELRDFGIRGVDLCYALADERYHRIIIVDVIDEPGEAGDIKALRPARQQAMATVNGHSLDLAQVFQQARLMGATLNNIVVVGCIPHSLEPDPEGISPLLRRQIPRVQAVILDLVSTTLWEADGAVGDEPAANQDAHRHA